MNKKVIPLREDSLHYTPHGNCKRFVEGFFNVTEGRLNPDPEVQNKLKAALVGMTKYWKNVTECKALRNANDLATNFLTKDCLNGGRKR